MTRFSPSDAALEGFRLAREHPGMILAWSLIYLGGIFLIGLTMLATLGPAVMEMIQKGQLLTADAKVMGDLLANSWSAFFVVLVMTVLLVSVIMGGIFRLVLRPDEPGFTHLKIGRDELRLAVVNLLLVLIGFAILFIGLRVLQLSTDLGGATMTLVGLIWLSVTIWIGVRLSLVTPLTFQNGRITIGPAWRLTRGRFWPLFGMILLALLAYVIVWTLITVIAFSVVEISGGEQAVQDFTKLTPITAIAAVVTLILQFMLQVLQVVMFYGPLAYANRELTAEKPQPRRSRITAGEPKEGGQMQNFFVTYDEAFADWSGVISRSFHWSALGYWFFIVMLLIVVEIGFAVAALTNDRGFSGLGIGGAFALAMPFNLMLLLSTVKRGRGAGIPGWLTALATPILPLVALGYAFLPVREAAD
jgi:hypothetical protein